MYNKSFLLIVFMTVVSVHSVFSMDEKKAMVIGYIKKDEASEVEKLIEKGFATWSTFRYGRTMLHEVVSYNAIKVARLLFNRHADINQADDLGSCPLHSLALYEDRHEIADLFFSSKLLIIDPQDRNGLTPLHHAVTQTNHYMIHRLMEKGANPSLCDQEGENAYDKALGASEILALLCEQ